MKILKIILKYKYLVFILIILLSLIRSNIIVSSKYKKMDTYFEGEILDYKEKEDYVTFTIRGKELLKCNYYFNNDKKIKLNYGDKIYLKGVLKEPNNNTIPNIFNYKKYLNNNNIFFVLNVEEVMKIEKNNNLFYKLKNSINN